MNDARDEAAAAKAEADADRAEVQKIRAELDAARAEADAAREESDAARADARDAIARLEGTQADAEDALGRAATEATAVADRVSELEGRLAEAEARAAQAEEGREQAEARAAEALERARGAEGLLAEAETLLVEAEAEFRRVREADAPAGGQAPPSAQDVGEVEPDPQRMNGVNGSETGRRPTTKVEVDTLVRRIVQESWGGSGRMVSVYAEPVVVLAPRGVIEAIVGDLLARSVQRTSEGNRIVVHVERADDGALISVEHGRPPEEDAMSAETRQLVAELGGWAGVEPHPGGGSILRVLLPRETSADAAISA
jgi:signal transduction histidine kinase